MHVFLDATSRKNLGDWKYAVEDRSISTKIFTPLWNQLVKLVPNTVAPNVLTLVGFIFTLYAYNLCLSYSATHTALMSIITCIFTFMYMNLDAIDGKHARRIKNSSPLGELFDHMCDNIGVVFMISSLCMLVGIHGTTTQWYIIQSAQIVFLCSHIDAFKTKVVRFGLFDGPGEALVLYMAILLINGTYGLDWLFDLVNDTMSSVPYNDTIIEHFRSGDILYTLYSISLLFTLIKSISLGSNHYSTRNGLVICLLTKAIPHVLTISGLMEEIPTFTVIGDGMALSVITSDIIVAKMANRELHPLIPVIMMISAFDNMLCVAVCVLYYIVVLSEISFHLRIPLLGVVRNVYCNGVFDMTHMGHMNLFEYAAKYGNRLIVGVHTDADVELYKRVPKMNEKIRYNTVKKCKHVDEVVEGAPLVVTEKFINRYNIHAVICSEEYDKEDDKYYAAPRKMGILIVKPRTDGISTSEIIRACQ